MSNQILKPEVLDSVNSSEVYRTEVGPAGWTAMETLVKARFSALGAPSEGTTTTPDYYVELLRKLRSIT